MDNKREISCSDKITGFALMQIDRRRTFAACNPHQCGRKDGARAMMTPKQKLEMHIQIVQSNARKLREWKQKGGKR